jgi:para-nitrobenzyl esterase
MNESKNLINRRGFIRSGAVAATAIVSGGPIARVLAQDARGAGPSQVVKTTAGQVRGVVLDGVSGFYGVPYAATTAGDGRFMPPTRTEPWPGVREMREVGNRSPQSLQGPIDEVYSLDRRQAMGEDCLNLNLWTPEMGQGDRPVMVWLHGGGHTSGSGDWLLYDGANLARRQDVVMVSISHRLNVFGYLYLNEIGGEKYAESGNVGTQDIVAALEWIRNNIASFGGDPGNVTVFGQSGGAGKVSTLMAMPSAKGLFHRAIAMSGSQVRGIPAGEATETAEKFMHLLDLESGPNQVELLRRMPMETLRATFAGSQLRLGPVVDGITLPGDPFYPGAPGQSADIPFLLGSTAHEVNFIPSTPLDDIDDTKLLELVKARTGTADVEAAYLISIYKKDHPAVDNVELFQVLASDNSFRVGVLAEAEAKVAQNAAPVYMYYFTWQSPVRKGRLKAYHCVDIPFALNNVDEATSMVGAVQGRYLLADRLSGAFAAFARTGNPGHAGIPDWPAFDLENRATMFVDNDWHVVDNPYDASREALKRIREATSS